MLTSAGSVATVLSLPDSAVAGSEHPAILEQHAAAVGVVAGLQADLPGPGVGAGPADPAHLGILKWRLRGQNILGRSLQGQRGLGQCGQRQGRGCGLAGGLTTRQSCNSHNVQGSKFKPHPPRGAGETPNTYRQCVWHLRKGLLDLHKQTGTSSQTKTVSRPPLPSGRALPTQPSTHQSHWRSSARICPVGRRPPVVWGGHSRPPSSPGLPAGTCSQTGRTEDLQSLPAHQFRDQPPAAWMPISPPYCTWQASAPPLSFPAQIMVSFFILPV